jgi:hypothetical protein
VVAQFGLVGGGPEPPGKKWFGGSHAAKEKQRIPHLVVPKNASLRQIPVLYRKQFTAADLQKYTKTEPIVPARQLLAELEAIHEEETRKCQKQ